ncbi:protein-export chaperone SecB [Ectothiorhodospiraceae bacterium 2226]|nr:protein-export chaperone SecB [Ectothiorhodospiraceae bacterium 2226]
MATENTDARGNGAATGEAATGRQFSIQKIYVKDVSFEAPNAPRIYTEQWEPSVNVELNTTGETLGDGVYDVVLAVTVTTKLKDKTAFLVEVQQGGVFNVANFPEEERNAMLGSYCPNVLFPFAREVIADLVTKGGFPPLLLAPVNFDQLYAQHREKQKAAAQQDAPESGASAS